MSTTPERALSEVRFLTVAEVASVMRVSKMTVYRLVHNGELPAVRVGRSFRVPEQAVHDYLRLAYGMRVQEVVLLLCLDARNHLLAVEEVAHGTLTEARVYPREVVKAALRQHAAAVILAHNHPSGDTGPSLADRELTEELGRALALVDVRLLDHLVISRHGCTSFAECGWLPA